MNNPIINVIVTLLIVGLIGWAIVGLFVLFVKWTWWVENGNPLQYLPFILPFAIAALVYFIVLISGIIKYILKHKDDEKPGRK